MKKKIYFENLDSLRFFCFLSVFLFHSFHTEFDHIKESEVYHFVAYRLFGNGNLGVNFFFVLSGFLITYLLIEEKKLNDNIHIRMFWIRRILRIWPLYFVCVIFGFYGFPIIKSAFGQTPNETASIWYYLTFTNNFDFINKGHPDASILGVLWSIAVEEQFYFIWPIILTVVPTRHYWVVFSTILITSLVFRHLNNNYTMHEYHTLSCIGDMTIGAFGAWLILLKKNLRNRIQRLRKHEIFIIYLIMLIIFFFRKDILFTNEIIRVFERPMIAMVMLLIILEQNYASNSFFKLSKFKNISWLGTISYGLYCLHFVGILIATNASKILGFNDSLINVLLLETSVAFGLTILMASISYKCLERPFLKMKENFSFISK